MNIFALAAAALVIGAPVADGPDADQSGAGNYLAFFVNTELEREFLFDRHTRNFVLVNGDSLGEDGNVPARAVDLDGLSRDLSRGPFTPLETTVRIVVAYRRWPPEASIRLLRYALIRVGHSSFKEVSVTSVKENPDRWKAALALVKEYGGTSAEAKAESGVGGGRCKVYPVRTALSRFSTHDADCVVVLGEQDGKAPGVKWIGDQEKTIAEAVGKLHLAKTEHILFWYGERPRGEEEGRFMDANRQLAKRLGFPRHSVRSY